MTRVSKQTPGLNIHSNAYKFRITEKLLKDSSGFADFCLRPATVEC